MMNERYLTDTEAQDPKLLLAHDIEVSREKLMEAVLHAGLPVHPKGALLNLQEVAMEVMAEMAGFAERLKSLKKPSDD